MGGASIGRRGRSLISRDQPGLDGQGIVIDPRVRLLIALGAIIAVGLIPIRFWWAYVAALLVVAALAAVAGLSPFYPVRRSFVALPFALAALSLPFVTPGTPLLHVPVVHLVISLEGTLRASELLLRSWLAVQIVILLTGTTSIQSLLWSMSALRIPGTLVAVIGFTYRYLGLLEDEALRMIRARAARSGSVGRGPRPSLAWQGQVAGSMVGSLFLRSVERSDRVYAAMLCRGYDGRVLAPERPHMAAFDWLVLAAAAAGLAYLLLVLR